MNIIEIENLTLEYDTEDESIKTKALDNVNLNIERGSFTAVIGKNGSGKSTLAKCLNALLLPSQGSVKVDGYDTSNEDTLWEVRQRAGMVFQNPDNQIVSAIVEDDIAFGPENLGVEKEEIKKRVEDALTAVDMLSERKKAPHLLSGGQKQRVAIAGVIAMMPKCIIFDEPTAMLDPMGRGEILKIIKDLNLLDITVILITHFMEEAIEADRVVILDQGKVVLDGKPREVFKEIEAIKGLGLDLPFAVDVVENLKGRGLSVPDNILSEDDLLKWASQLRI